MKKPDELDARGRGLYQRLAARVKTPPVTGAPPAASVALSCLPAIESYAASPPCTAGAWSDSTRFRPRCFAT
jgi:hypothetical protein